MIIKPKCDISFVGAKSGQRQRLLAGVLREVEAEEIGHLDPADYEEVKDPKAKSGDVVPVAPAPVQRKKK